MRIRPHSKNINYILDINLSDSIIEVRIKLMNHTFILYHLKRKNKINERYQPE